MRSSGLRLCGALLLGFLPLDVGLMARAGPAEACLGGIWVLVPRTVLLLAGRACEPQFVWGLCPLAASPLGISSRPGRARTVWRLHYFGLARVTLGVPPVAGWHLGQRYCGFSRCNRGWHWG